MQYIETYQLKVTELYKSLYVAEMLHRDVAQLDWFKDSAESEEACLVILSVLSCHGSDATLIMLLVHLKDKQREGRNHGLCLQNFL